MATAALTVLGLGLCATPPAAATSGPQNTIVGAESPGSVQNSYIVVLKDSAFAASSARGKTLASAHGAEVTSTYRHALNGFAAKMSESQALAMAAEPAVARVVQDTVFKAEGTQPAPSSWGLDRIDHPDRPVDGTYTYPDRAGAGVTVYVIDTGVRLSHQDFAGRASCGYDHFGGTCDDGFGHGTHVAAIAAGRDHGVAKTADVVAVKVLDDSGSGTASSVLAGVDWVTAHASGPAVANMSISGPASDLVDDAVRRSVAKGVTYTVAAGNNNGDASGRSPARMNEVITVGASTGTDARARFSNYGPTVDLYAPGFYITSAGNTDDTAAVVDSGTSMAAPHAAGAAALHLADHPTVTPASVEDALTGAASYGRLSGIPAGTVNALLHTGTGSGAPVAIDPPKGTPITSDTDVEIKDHVTSESPMTVSGVDPGKLGNGLEVAVDIKHGWVWDLTVEAIAPDGSSWRVHEHSGPAENLKRTYLLRLPEGMDVNGTWALKVSDSEGAHEGIIDSWSLRF
ncbi:S8 family peptidase [Streptomyces mutabilis]|uniref:S8 family peptidase n=1 Tax=Streptomyces mutabilis TaxID=67332 RepID=UPI00367D7297